MPYISADALQQARRMDLLTYLQMNEPGNLVRLSGNNYCTREHDSLKISNGKWHWFSRGIGGVSALDYLIKVKEYTLPDAVEALVGRSAMETPAYSYAPKRQEPRRLLMGITGFPMTSSSFMWIRRPARWCGRFSTLPPVA